MFFPYLSNTEATSSLESNPSPVINPNAQDLNRLPSTPPATTGFALGFYLEAHLILVKVASSSAVRAAGGFINTRLSESLYSRLILIWLSNRPYESKLFPRAGLSQVLPLNFIDSNTTVSLWNYHIGSITATSHHGHSSVCISFFLSLKRHFVGWRSPISEAFVDVLLGLGIMLE